MHGLATELFPICGSITGGSARQKIGTIKQNASCLAQPILVPSGTS
jgi:aminopeptidase-like protein